MKWYFQALRKYAVFSGRARRREYWIFELWNAVILIVLLVVDTKISASAHRGPVLVGLYVLATLLPSFAGSIRRLHDTNHSGWWLLIGSIPFIGQLILLMLLIKDSDPGPNRYGPNPKTEPSANPLPEMGHLAPPLPRERR